MEKTAYLLLRRFGKMSRKCFHLWKWMVRLLEKKGALKIQECGSCNGSRKFPKRI